VQALNEAKLTSLKAKTKAPFSGVKLAFNSEAKTLLRSAKIASLSEAKAHGEANFASPMAKEPAFKKAKPKASNPRGLLSSLLESLCWTDWA